MNWLLLTIGDDQSHDRARLAIKKVTKFVELPEGEKFLQTSTVFQWYELEVFEAYHHLGYLIGLAYLANVNLPEDELRPNAAYRVPYCGTATGVKNWSARDRQGYGPAVPCPPD